MSSLKRFVIPVGRVLLLLTPFFWAAALVARNGVDVPYTDQWTGEYPLFARMADGTLGPGDFFAQHNEHRIVFPRLIFYALDRLTHWDVRAELWVILALALAISFNFRQMFRATGWNASSGVGYWMLLAANVLLFSPLHRENFLWGFQVGFLLPLTCMTACLWVGLHPSARVRFGGVMALGVVCSFSIASGFLCWLLSWPLLAQAGGSGTWKRDRGWWLAWALTFAACVVGYFHGYEKPGHHPSVWTVAHAPALAAGYALTFLGLPFAFGTALNPLLVAQVAAVVMLLVLAAALAFLWKTRVDAALRRRCLPWLLLASISLVNAAMATLGRAGLGLAQALTSRYVIFAIFLPIGLTAVAVAIHRHPRPETPSAAVRTGGWLVALGTALALLHLLGAFNVAPGWEEFSRSLLKSKALVETINVVDEPELVETYVYDHPLKDAVTVLGRLGYLHPGPLRSGFIDEIADAPTPAAGGNGGAVERTGRGPDHSLRMSGWAVLSGKDRPADAVLFTYDDAAGRPVIFALAETGVARADVAGTLGKAACLRCGWQKAFKPGAPPPGAGAVRAWSFDAETGRASRLTGQADPSG